MLLPEMPRESLGGLQATLGFGALLVDQAGAHRPVPQDEPYKHPDCYVGEFTERHNMREQDSVAQMQQAVRGMNGKRLQYRDMISDNVMTSYDCN